MLRFSIFYNHSLSEPHALILHFLIAFWRTLRLLGRPANLLPLFTFGAHIGQRADSLAKARAADDRGPAGGHIGPLGRMVHILQVSAQVATLSERFVAE